MSTQDHIFNQYFLDFLKKLKVVCKQKKQESHDAREILRGIKKHYQNNDLLTAAFRAHMNTSAEAWDAYGAIAQEDEAAFSSWLAEQQDNCILFEDIPMSSVCTMMSDTHMLHHYLTVINIFRPDMPEEMLTNIIDVLKNLGAKDKNVLQQKLEAVDNATAKAQLERIVYMYAKRAETVKDDPLMDNISAIENTSLGKLAKEILEEVNVDELQSSIGNGDIMSALTNPDGGFVKLLGTVSQKMISKMSTGEIKQENLLQDAMKLASQFGGAGGLGPLTDIASMFSGGSGGGGGGDGFDMSNLTKMMSNMMGGGAGGSGRHRMRPNTEKLKRMSKARDMRHKLEKKRKETVKENVTVHVEDD